MAASAVSDRSRCQAALFSAAKPIIRAHRVGNYEFQSVAVGDNGDNSWSRPSSHLLLNDLFYSIGATCLAGRMLLLRQGNDAFIQIVSRAIALR